MAGIDINRTTAGIYLPPEVSGEVWQGVQEGSAVAALSNYMTLPGSGVTVDVITGDPEAAWVAETDEKPVSRGSASSKTMQGYTLAVIVPFSNQFRRDKNTLYNAMVNRLPGVLARKIDETIFFGSAPGSNFDVLTGVDTVALGAAGQADYDSLVDVEVALAEAGYSLDGYALSARGVGILRKVKDNNGAPLLGGLGGFDNLMGYPVKRTQAVHLDPNDAGVAADTVGFAGQWSTATFGVVEDIAFSISDQATINDGGTPLNLWQRNMFAVRVEMEVGFRVRDEAGFRRITGAVTNP